MHQHAKEIIGIYRRHARVWATRRRSGIGEDKWLDAFLHVAGPRPCVLDIGCGSGQPMATYLDRAGAHITGVDSAPEMVETAQAAVPGATWHVADMRDLDLGVRFNGVLAWNSFFHLTPDDQRQMFAVFQRHTAPCAALMFTSGTGHGTAMGEFEGEPLYHASLDPEEFRGLLDQHGFDVVDHVVEDPDCGHHTIWLAQQREGA